MAHYDNKKYLVGIDEVGRGPLAGPVTVCACAVPINTIESIKQALPHITDSKKLSEAKREEYYAVLEQLAREKKIFFAVSHTAPEYIDAKGIQPAIRSALSSSLSTLPFPPAECFVYLDGGLFAPKDYAQETVIKGDQTIFVISLASVIAKVLRDRIMCDLAKQYPNYGFEKHKGYGTKAHKEAIQRYGVCDIHRKTWIKA